ncbi:MAG: hypothetical protein NC177_07275 [Ruminococcus flavefaciens]|nr:hypothetical protein [Ruminococcus flavefaciens]
MIITNILTAVMAFSVAGNTTANINFGDGSADVTINSEMFEQNSNGYHSDIALLSSVLSQCAYNGENLNNAYNQLGFDLENDVTLFGYANEKNNADYTTDLINSEEDSQAFSLATKELDGSRLLVVNLRGTNLNSTSDILTDISIFGTNFCEDSSPTGFVNFFRKVSIGMSLYLDEHPEIKDSADNGNLKILITGHSLGGAGTNLLGAYFNTHEDNSYSGFDGNNAVNLMYNEILDIPQSDIFVYSFACPNIYYGDPTVFDCDNIINVINESDLIPQVPDGNKFGQSVYFDTNDDNGLSAHYGYKYINAVENEIPDGVRYYGGAVDTKINENMFSQDSTEYHKDIAEVAVALSSASYNGRREAGYYINSAYRQLGFTADNIEIYGYPSEDYSFSIASQEIGETTLLAVTLKGNSGQKDFYSQIDKDFSQPFMDSMTNPDYYDFYIRVKNALDEYISVHDILNIAQNGKLKVLISGHSIGGAGASLVGAWLNSPDSMLKIPAEDIFVYTFGSPCVYSSAVDCPNVINVMNESDIVTLRPFGAKSGKTVAFDTGSFGMDCYEPRIYAENLPDVADSYVTYSQITINNPYADFNITENNNLIDKDNVKMLSDDEHTYIYLPSGNYKINFSGNTDEIFTLSAKNQNGFSINYNNINISDGKNIVFDMNDNAMFVNDENGKHIMKILTDGTEQKIKKSADSMPETSIFVGAGAVLVVGISAVLIKRRKKGE